MTGPARAAELTRWFNAAWSLDDLGCAPVRSGKGDLRCRFGRPAAYIEALGRFERRWPGGRP